MVSITNVNQCVFKPNDGRKVSDIYSSADFLLPEEHQRRPLNANRYNVPALMNMLSLLWIALMEIPKIYYDDVKAEKTVTLNVIVLLLTAQMAWK